MFYPRPLVTAAWLAQHLDDPEVIVVDCRFALADPHQGGQQYTAGHIPGAWYLKGSISGAVNYFWQDVSTAQGQMKTPVELAQHWADLNAAEDIIVYCGSGITACVNLLAQAVAGRSMTKLYPGGWGGWCSYR